MDDQISEKLKNILQDPDSLKSILSIASAFSENASTNKSANKHESLQAETNVKNTTDEENAQSEYQSDVEKISHENTAIAAFSPFEQKPRMTDDRVNLLLSIKPFLSERKRQRVDSVVKALGAAKLISAYKDLDFLTKFGL